MSKPFSIFTAEDFKGWVNDIYPNQGCAEFLADHANAILNERGTRVGQIDVVLQGPISATVWSHNMDRTHFTHEALLLGQREIEK